MAKIVKKGENPENGFGGVNHSEHLWSKISKKSNELKYLEQITGAMIRYPGITGDEVDDIELLKHSSNIRYLYTDVMEDVKKKFFSNIEKQDDLNFLEGQVTALVGFIVKESWDVSKGNYNTAKKLSDNAVYLMESLIEQVPKIKIKQAFISLPENMESKFVASNLLIPCIRTLVRIKSLNEENLFKVVPDGDVEKLSTYIIEDIISATKGYVDSICDSSGVNIEDLDSKQKNVLLARARNSIKETFGNILESDFNRMEATGSYSDIYSKIQETAEFFFPIIYQFQHEKRTFKKVLDKDTDDSESYDIGKQKTIKEGIFNHCKESLNSLLGAMPLSFSYYENGNKVVIPFESFGQYLSESDFKELNDFANQDDAFSYSEEQEKEKTIETSVTDSENTLKDSVSSTKPKPNNVKDAVISDFLESFSISSKPSKEGGLNPQ